MKGGGNVLVTLKKMKEYLKVDFDDDDAVIRHLEGAAEKMVMDIMRVDSLEPYKNDHYTVYRIIQKIHSVVDSIRQSLKSI